MNSAKGIFGKSVFRRYNPKTPNKYNKNNLNGEVDNGKHN